MTSLTRRRLCLLAAGATAIPLSGCLELYDMLNQSARFCGAHVYNMDDTGYHVSFRLLDGSETIHEEMVALGANEGIVVIEVTEDDLPYNEGSFTASFKLDSGEWEDLTVTHRRHDELFVSAIIQEESITGFYTHAAECDSISDE